MDLGLANKIAVVQGASRGLGYGVANSLSTEGARVVICSRNRSEIESAAKTIQTASGNPVLPVVCDVTNPEQRTELFNNCRKGFGPPDILVCNAGGPPPGNFIDFTAQDYRKALETNFLSAVESVRSVVEDMKARGWGRILFITSMAVKQPIDTLILSNSARSALTAYAKTISRDLAPFGITVNCILPGLHRTQRLESLARQTSENTGKTMEETWDELAADVPVGRLGTIEEFGSVAAFLCSEKASFITGQSIVHDGGTVRGLF
ncbi:MAG: SDR family oxidoreductase [FCB group bacterium]|nr:SDR family oxidoreductase [FCB group bacterium]